ncbi:MAG: CREG family protein [Bryobacteraceae bacterium]|nr:CREG family protein [Bryobacteraceae bacterium]MDW8378835.1 pyridoxamine 5'-phosphate oxidase family protein [Bryobacterales bacterium]
MEKRSEKARALVESRGFGVLATLSKRLPGYPFASVMPYACDSKGQPIFLLSRLAVHTKNLLENPRASLLVYEPAAETDPLGAARLNLMGEVTQIEPGGSSQARALYLQKHPDAEPWLNFGDFGLYQMRVDDVYYIGGFGEMGWVSKNDYLAESNA